MVERFFRDPTQNQLRWGVFRDLEELHIAIGNYIDGHNENPKPFILTARAGDIQKKVKRARRALKSVTLHDALHQVRSGATATNDGSRFEECFQPVADCRVLAYIAQPGS